MPGVLDNALKHLSELSPGDWVVQGGWSAASTTVIDADIATITGASDKVIRVQGQPDWLLAVDFQAGHDTLAKLPDLLLYNSALYRRHELPVRSLLVVLHAAADSPRLTGLYERGYPDAPFDVALQYRILRVWQVPPEKWLSGGLGIVPLAPLGDVREAALPAVIAKMKQRLDREPRRARELWSATYILMGLRYEQAVVNKLLQGVVAMKESVTYQAIIEEGETNEARKILLLLGGNYFGKASPKIRGAINGLTDLRQLEELLVRLPDASDWQELLGLPETGRRRPNGRKSS
jgi:hypothetical protein